jgi:glucose/mannose transport system permease protein
MKHNRKNTAVALLVLLPSAALVAVFVYGFIGDTIYVSMTAWGTGAGLAENPARNLIGLENHGDLFGGFINARFRQDLVNAIFYTLFLIVGALAVGLTLAILLDHGPWGEGVFRSIFLYPMALSFVVTGTIWRWLLAPNGGINLIPTWFGASKIEFLWLSSRQQVLTFDRQSVPQIIAVVIILVTGTGAVRRLRRGNRRRAITLGVVALLALLYAAVFHRFIPNMLPYEERHGLNLALIGVSLASIWQYSGYTMALYLAGLRGLPPNLYESAVIDGASDFTYYLRIALPNMLPIPLSPVIVLSHISLKLFALIFSMAGADNASTGHPSVLMYLATFRANEFAKGAAIAVVLFLLAALFIIPYLVNSYRQRS